MTPSGRATPPPAVCAPPRLLTSDNQRINVKGVVGRVHVAAVVVVLAEGQGRAIGPGATSAPHVGIPAQRHIGEHQVLRAGKGRSRQPCLLSPACPLACRPPGGPRT